MDILRLLDGSACTVSYDVIEFRQWQTGLYYRVRVKLRDSSVLHVREYVDESSRNYSYHWESEDGKLLVRWDNAPHHKHLTTYPHHKHIGDGVQESQEVQFEEVLHVIGDILA